MVGDSLVRVCFEAWYIDHFKNIEGFDLTLEDLEIMRTEDGYDGNYLNNIWNACWAGFMEGQTIDC